MHYMELLITSYLFVVGAAFGSFALVLADRMKTKRDWVKGRSKCDFCDYTLNPRDLVPLLSWIAVKGRCRKCKKKLSPAYPATELLAGVLFAVSYTYAPYDLSGIGLSLFVIWLFALIIMTALFVYDLRWQLLPTKLIRPLWVLGLLHSVLVYFVFDKTPLNHMLSVLAAILVGSGVFALLYVVSRGRWIGDGDIRFGVVIGLFSVDPIVAWLSIFTASVLGLLVGVPYMVKSKKMTGLKVPFGPYLILGLVFAYLLGQKIINWYFTEFLYR